MHLDDLRRVDDLDAAIVAAVFLELRFDARPVTGQVKLGDARLFCKCEHRAVDNIARRVIASHRIKRNFHSAGAGFNIPANA